MSGGDDFGAEYQLARLGFDWLTQRGGKQVREAQVEYYRHTAEFQRNTIALQAASLEVSVANARLNYAMHLERMQEAREGQIRQVQLEHASRQSLSDRVHQLQRWPLTTDPVSLLEASVSRQGRALNIIVCLAGQAGEDAPGVQAFRSVLQSAMTLVTSVTVPRFARQVVLYDETREPITLTHEAAQTAIWGLLRTEPTALVYLEPRGPSAIDVTISEWGVAFAPRHQIGAATRFTLESAGDAPIHQRRLGLVTDLSEIVVALGDSFQAIHHSHELPSPVLPWLMEFAQAQGIAEDRWQFSLQHYEEALQNVASHSLAVAAELAGQAAIDAHDRKLLQLAERLLARGLAFGSRLSGRHPPLLQTALEKIKGETVTRPAERTSLKSVLREANQIQEP